MKKILLTACTLLALHTLSTAQTYSENLSVLLHAQVQSSPAQIKLEWTPDATATQYKVYRKTAAAIAWGPAVATLPGTDSLYTDNSVTAGTLYEYKVQRTSPSGAGYGYLLSGVERNINYNKGYLILAIDSFFTVSLAPEIAMLIKDYEADGWFVKRFDIDRSNTVINVKAQIQAIYNLNTFDTKSLMLLGHIPVPYSGLMNPDGHPDHLGAWPADVYYADMLGSWDDVSVNDVSATDPRNRNIPGDGKFDTDVLAIDTKLEVGRVDFYNLPVFSKTETELMRDYLNKLHAFKTRQFIPLDKALIEDNFTGMAEGFSATGFMNFAPLVSPDQTFTGDYTTDLQSNSYLCSYGTGPGSYTSAGSTVSSSDFANDSIQSVFTFLFGSYFGDWDTQNNLLRASLASGTVLTNAWAGRPHWHIHQMGMGEHIGYSAKLTQNNNGSLYFSSTLGLFNRWIHIALMGDPALRLHYVKPPGSISSSLLSSGYVLLSWTASPEAVSGYHVYRREISTEQWEQVTLSPIPVLNLGDLTIPSAGTYVYMVRAVKPQTTASGNYYNQSLGITDTITATVGVQELGIKTFELYPNPAAHTLYIAALNDMQEQPLVIVNSLGETVYSRRVSMGKNETLSIDLAGFTSGVYIVRLNGSAHRVVKE